MKSLNITEKKISRSLIYQSLHVVKMNNFKPLKIFFVSVFALILNKLKNGVYNTYITNGLNLHAFYINKKFLAYVEERIEESGNS